MLTPFATALTYRRSSSSTGLARSGTTPSRDATDSSRSFCRKAWYRSATARFLSVARWRKSPCRKVLLHCPTEHLWRVRSLKALRSLHMFVELVQMHSAGARFCQRSNCRRGLRRSGMTLSLLPVSQGSHFRKVSRRSEKAPFGIARWSQR